MNKFILRFLVLSLLFTPISILAQTKVAPDKYWVAFTDKNATPFSIDKPEDFLSKRAIDRRTKYNIAINKNDLPVNPSYIDSIKSLGVQVYYSSKWLNGALIYTTDLSVIDKIKKLPFVKDYDVHTQLASKNEPKEKLKVEESAATYKISQIEKQENRYDYGYAENQIAMLNGIKLHNEGYTGKGMLIAVLDAGFYHVNMLPAFDSLRANNQIIGTTDFVDMDTSVYDADTHGMMVLSTMGGNIPGEIVGTAPDASYYLIRTEDAGSENIIEEFNWVAGAEFADSIGADIIHSSLGYSLFDDTTVNHKYSDMDGNTAPSSIGADMAASKGMIVTVSAGNEGADAWHYITSPADADSVLTVGAVDKDGYYAYFSSTGPTPDGRIKPNVMAQGQSSTVEGSAGNVSSASGTSFSGPITAGMVACLWQAHPELNNMQIISAIEHNSSRTTSPDSLYGYGIPDYYLAMLYPTDVKNNESEKNKINIYPNPFTESFNINLNEKKRRNNIIIEVFNMDGKKLFYKKLKVSNHSNIDFDQLANLSKGMYILKLRVNKENYNFKMLKQ